jgi:hypothetical protein
MKRGRDKNEICNGARRAENGMRDNYRFILPVIASHFRSVSKTASIPEDLGQRRCNTPNNNNNRLGGVTTLQDNNKT